MMKNQSPSRTESPDVDLFLVGAGVSFPIHLTVQTIEVLSVCKHICTNLSTSDLDALPEDLKTKCESLWPLYQDNRNRAENYRDVANVVIDRAERERPVAWMTPGHPFIFDSVSQTLLKAGRARGWQVSVVPGISCLDTILAELGYDPAGGLLIHEATSAVRRQLRLQPSFATLLLQPSAFGSDLAHLSSDWSPDLVPLRDYLLQFYAPEQDCGFIRSASSTGGRSQVFWTKLQDITTVPVNALAGSTLFLPEATISRVPLTNPVRSVRSAPRNSKESKRAMSRVSRSRRPRKTVV